MKIIPMSFEKSFELETKKRILITGNPRSGNVWLTRLISDALNCVPNFYKRQYSLANPDLKPSGNWDIYQMHVIPIYHGDYQEFFATMREVFVPKWSGEKVIHIYRDPRDTAVSIMHYWKLSSIEESINRMVNNIGNILRWDAFVSSWLNCNQIPVMNISYEDLRFNTEESMKAILDYHSITFSENLSEIVKRNSFDIQKAQINLGKNKIKKEHIRHGVVGEWKEIFTKSDLDLIYKHFGQVMDIIGYK